MSSTLASKDDTKFQLLPNARFVRLKKKGSLKRDEEEMEKALYCGMVGCISV